MKITDNHIRANVHEFLLQLVNAARENRLVPMNSEAIGESTADRRIVMHHDRPFSLGDSPAHREWHTRLADQTCLLTFTSTSSPIRASAAETASFHCSSGATVPPSRCPTSSRLEARPPLFRGAATASQARTGLPLQPSVSRKNSSRSNRYEGRSAQKRIGARRP